jgi:hypothetical protein
LPGWVGARSDPGGTVRGGELQASKPSAAAIIKPVFTTRVRCVLALLILEALGAMVLLVFIVWWTMFSGRKNGELKDGSKDHLKDK